MIYFQTEAQRFTRILVLSKEEDDGVGDSIEPLTQAKIQYSVSFFFLNFYTLLDSFIEKKMYGSRNYHFKEFFKESLESFKYRKLENGGPGHQ